MRGPTPIRPAPIDGIPASHWQLPPGPWATVLDALCDRFVAIPRATWLQRIVRGRVLDAGGGALAADAVYRVGMDIYYYREVAGERAIPFEEKILHVDEHLVVADKPHFLPVTPAGGFVRETLLGRLQRRLDNPALVPLHRIDRDTAGLVLFSANPDTRGQYQALFRERLIEKRYEALAPGLHGLSFPYRCRSRLTTGTPFFRMQETQGAANSETLIDVVARNDSVWRYALQPITGRKHQLRVHMAALGAPILGDNLYPELRDRQPGDFQRPLQLLARALCFIDPLDGRERRFESVRDLREDVSAAGGA